MDSETSEQARYNEMLKVIFEQVVDYLNNTESEDNIANLVKEIDTDNGKSLDLNEVVYVTIDLAISNFLKYMERHFGLRVAILEGTITKRETTQQ